MTVSGPGLAMEHMITHLMVQGAMVYSGGAGLGQPFIHLGPSATRREADGAAMMHLFGQRFAAQAARLFG